MKIPLYNQTGQPSVQTKAQQLSPRASAGVFTSQGQAMAQLGQQIAQTGEAVADNMIRFRQQQEKIEFDFAMAEKQAETERALDEARIAHNEQAMKFIEENKDTDTTVFRTNYDTFNKDFLSQNIDTRTDLTDKQKQAVRSGLNAQMISKGNSGAKNAFDRAQVIRGQAARDSLAGMIQDRSSYPEGHPERLRLEGQIEERILKAERDGLRTGYTVQGVKVGFETLDLDAQVRGATSFSQLEAIEKQVGKSALGAQGRSRIHSAIKTRKSELRSDIYQSNLAAIQAIEVQFDDQEDLKTAIINGTPYQGVDANGDEVVVDTSGLKDSTRISIAQSMLPQKFKDLDDFRTQAMVDGLVSNAEIGGDILTTIESASALYDEGTLELTGKSPEDVDAAILEAAKQMANQAYREIASGEFDENRVNSLMNNSQALIEQTIGGRQPLSRNIETSDNAGKISNVIVRARGDLKVAQDKMEQMNRGMELANTGDINIIDIGLTGSEKQKIISSGIEAREGNIPAQIDFLQANGAEHSAFTSQLKQTKAKMEDPSFAGLDEEDQKALALFTMMSMDGKEAVFDNHIKGNDRAFWNSYKILSEAHGSSQAIDMMRVQRRDQKAAEISYKTISDQVEKGTAMFEEGTIASAFRTVTFNYFGTGEPPVLPVNTSDITSDIKNLTIEYLKFGIDPELALQTASEDYFKTHQLVGNRMHKRRKGDPTNLSELNDVLVGNFVSQNTAFLEDEDLEATDLAIMPASETSSDLWILVRSGGVPVMAPSPTEDQPYRRTAVTYTLEELNQQQAEADRLADERRLEKAKKSIGESVPQDIENRSRNRSRTGRVR